MGLEVHDIRDQVGRGDKPGEMSTLKLIYSSNKVCVGPHYVAGALLGTGGAAVNTAG